MTSWGTERDPVGFWTILFAVAGGVLLADLVRMLFAALAAGALLAGFSSSVERAAAQPPTAAELYPGRSVEALPGPVAARANAISRACIGGYAADRDGAGWSQARPSVPCTASSE